MRESWNEDDAAPTRVPRLCADHRHRQPSALRSSAGVGHATVCVVPEDATDHWESGEIACCTRSRRYGGDTLLQPTFSLHAADCIGWCGSLIFFPRCGLLGPDGRPIAAGLPTVGSYPSLIARLIHGVNSPS